MATIDTAYQYYLSTYGNSTTSRYDAHKKSQLRDVYNKIVKTNKESPLYKIKNTNEAQKFAIDIKERAHSIQNVVASLSDEEGGIENAFSRRIAESSDEEAVGAEYIGLDKFADRSFQFDIEVKQLASTQVNIGNYLNPDRSEIHAGSYSFNLSTTLSSYEFQFNVGSRDTNQTVQEKIMRLINNSNVGLHADIVKDKNGYGALRIESKEAGLAENEDYLFEVLPSPESHSMRAMQTLGIDKVSQPAQNSMFLLNGDEHTAFSNTVTINDAFELTFKQPSKTAAKIGFKADADAIADNVESLVNVYNNIITLSKYRTDLQQSNLLLNDMSGIARRYHEDLSSMGIHMEEDGSLNINQNELSDSLHSSKSGSYMNTLNRFRESLGQNASNASIDPMNYINKIVVAYKNPGGHNYPTPYITSIYSGMMLDHIC